MFVFSYSVSGWYVWSCLRAHRLMQQRMTLIFFPLRKFSISLLYRVKMLLYNTRFTTPVQGRVAEWVVPYPWWVGTICCASSCRPSCALFSSALFVTLTDDSFPADKFEFVRGQHAVRWDRISPGSNVSHVIIVRPLEAGNFNFSMARVAYKPAEGREEKVRLYVCFL